ncbi:hypothetical protein ACN28G_03095 [Micromonospora sp. WMMA1923]|uniref:hypothetical protein n=1 Tax=Micromonospora sp. WMMA1923 TaxID=3404125 RepID=UPI003B92DF22
MSFVPPLPKSRRWTFTAVTAVVVPPALVWGVDRSYRATDRCLRANGTSINDPDAEQRPSALARLQRRDLVRAVLVGQQGVCVDGSGGGVLSLVGRFHVAATVAEQGTVEGGAEHAALVPADEG